MDYGHVRGHVPEESVYVLRSGVFRGELEHGRCRMWVAEAEVCEGACIVGVFGGGGRHGSNWRCGQRGADVEGEARRIERSSDQNVQGRGGEVGGLEVKQVKVDGVVEGRMIEAGKLGIVLELLVLMVMLLLVVRLRLRLLLLLLLFVFILGEARRRRHDHVAFGGRGRRGGVPVGVLLLRLVAGKRELVGVEVPGVARNHILTRRGDGAVRADMGLLSAVWGRGRSQRAGSQRCEVQTGQGDSRVFWCRRRCADRLKTAGH